mmetsp:Transcript_21123/g.39635  ORF Transcript_21123/g.39635 Transcript_21123/m.39635 type:complete len:344 (-) Transcript_21123:2669-3700(-)
MVEQGQKQGDGLLGSVNVNLGHVHVVDEDDQFLASGRAVDATGPLVDIVLNVQLHVPTAGLATHIDGELGELLGIQALGVVLDGQGLGSSALSDVQDGLQGREFLKHVRVEHALRSRNHDLVEVEWARLLVLDDLSFPVQPPVLLNVIVVVVHELVRHGLVGELLDEGVELDARVVDELSTDSPQEAVQEDVFGVRGGEITLSDSSDGGEEAVEHAANLLGQINVADSDDLVELLSHLAVDQALQDVVDTLDNVPIEELGELVGLDLILGVDVDRVAAPGPDPALVVGPVAQVLGVDPDHTAAGDCGGGRILQIEDLADHRAVRLEPDALSVGERQKPVVVHD